MSESSMTIWIRTLDVFETIIFIVLRFVQPSQIGLYCWAAFLVIQLLLLALQFIFAEWGGVARLKTILWIAFYVILFMIDILGIDVIGIVAQKIGPTMVKADNYLANSWVGDLLASALIVVLKWFLGKEDD